MNTVEAIIQAKIEFAELEEKAWAETIADANTKGEQIYYDMGNPVKYAITDPDTGEDVEMLIGHYKTRPCPNHTAGHRCNPPRNARIVGL